ncbi:hypothetical protein ANN_23359 [Periplaneta americana]|uniref:Uncharacterized protein n=1 Tax=Periplaneta americana TaxID=6978 RepID=A0ABQ8SKY8_PERAM|nr:hypothetical protein ANN_23359 [Periplaneta americana]
MFLLKIKKTLFFSNKDWQEDRDITYALFCSVLCIMEQVLFDEILILSVEENPHVYDKRRSSYKDEKMENTWLLIAASLNTDPMTRSGGDVIIDRLFCIDGIDDSEMVFGEMKSGIRQRLHDIRLTVGENLGKKPNQVSWSFSLLLRVSMILTFQAVLAGVGGENWLRIRNLQGSSRLGTLRLPSFRFCKQLRGQRYETLEDILKEVRQCLREDETDFYSKGSFKLTEQWEK